MKITNRLKKKVLVLDGIDNDFLDSGAEIACPECEGVIIYSIVNAYEFDLLSEEVKDFLVKKMRGVKFVSEPKKYIYDESQLYVSKNTCSKCVYAIKDYKSLVLKHPDIQDEHYYGATWSHIIAKNKNEFIEPDTTWINTISLNNY